MAQTVRRDLRHNGSIWKTRFFVKTGIDYLFSAICYLFSEVGPAWHALGFMDINELTYEQYPLQISRFQPLDRAGSIGLSLGPSWRSH